MGTDEEENNIVKVDKYLEVQGSEELSSKQQQQLKDDLKRTEAALVQARLDSKTKC